MNASKTAFKTFRFVARCCAGVLVLLPAFMVWGQFAVLSNIAHSEGAEGYWHAAFVPIGALVYVAVLGYWAFTKRPSFLRDGYLAGYAGYVAGMYVWIISGNVTHQLALYSVTWVLAEHFVDILFLAPALGFLIDRTIFLSPVKTRTTS